MRRSRRWVADSLVAFSTMYPRDLELIDRSSGRPAGLAVSINRLSGALESENCFRRYPDDRSATYEMYAVTRTTKIKCDGPIARVWVVHFSWLFSGKTHDARVL